MEKKIELNWLLDFYGALLTDHRREIMRMYLEEDLSLQEIADAMRITRQGVHDAISHAGEQLERYEAQLGLLRRFRDVRRAVADCREELARVGKCENESALERAKAALERVENIEG